MVESYLFKGIKLKNTMIEEIMQVLSEKIENTGAEIEDTLLCGYIQSATFLSYAIVVDIIDGSRNELGQG